MVRKPRILAVDDTPSNLIALEAVLDREFDLRYARSGQEAIASLTEDHDVDVILMDVQMPGMDGFEAAGLIKQIPGCLETPIVFVTAVYTEDPHLKRGYQVGGVDYFTKPFDPDLLRLKVGIYASFRQRAALLKERELQIRATEELFTAGKKLSGLLESLPVGVLIADVDGRICQSNDEVSRICKSAELIKNDEYGKMLGWWDASGRLFKAGGGPLSRALHAKESQTEMMQIQCVDGTTKAVLTSASPLFGLDGHIVGAVIVIQDVSEPKRIGAELQHRIARLVSLGVELEESIQH
ncbi:MAG TPA: response regulator [Kofleriaceae bacterium]|nr:response regulator [Kofleriaceae bacterium]